MRRGPREALRQAVDCLPKHTRAAMLEGIGRNDIIVGAYTDRRGGVCPMLAAHRCGGRTDFLAFAHAWDRFTKAKRPRRATEREIRTLVAYLQAATIAEPVSTSFNTAISEHQAAARERRAREAASIGWDWLAEAERDADDADASPREHELV